MRNKARKAAAALILGALFVFMLSGAALAAPPWSDASNQFWTHTYGVTDVQVGTVAGGYADGTFRPDQSVTRAELTKMAVSGLGIATQNPATPTFIDVPPGSAFYVYVEGAYAAGLVKGTATPAGLVFGPNTNISRQQANSILGRYLSGQEIEATGAITGVLGGETPGFHYSSLENWYGSEGFGDLTRFADHDQVLPAHAQGTAYLVFRGVINGSGGKLNPEAKLSRAEAAAMVLRVKGATFTPTPPTVGEVVPASGPVAGGNTVSIWGSHLTGATAVTFGGTNAASYHVDQDGGITAVVPAHAAGTVDVIVTSPYGSGIGANDYIYTTAPPVVTRLSPSNGPVAGGTEVEITGTDLTGATAVMFGTTPATSFTVDRGGEEITAVTPAHAAGTVDVIVATSNASSVSTAGSAYVYSDTVPAEFPLDQPVDLIRRTSAPWVWNAVVADHTVAYVESDSFGFASLSQADTTQRAVITTFDLETGKVSAVPGGELSSPMFNNDFAFWPWWFLAEVPQAKGGTGPSLVWAVGNTQYDGGGIMRWQNLTGWNSSVGTRAVFSPETMTLPPIRTGDILALPLTSPAFENAHGGMVGATLGEKLLLLTPNLDQPIAVDPAAPVLPAAALEGLSPYVSWSGWLLGQEPTVQYASQFRADLPGEPPRVFDLRSGKLVDIAVKDPRTPDDWLASVVAGHWAAWVAMESSPTGSSLYLADLATGQAQRLGDAPTREIALSNDWLLWTDSSGNLLGCHLPDMTPVRLAGMLASGEEVRNLQISGDLAVLMVVAQESNVIGPDFSPRWTAIRVVRLR